MHSLKDKFNSIACVYMRNMHEWYMPPWFLMQHIKKNTNSSTRFCADLQNWIKKGRCPCKNEYDIDGSLFALSLQT